MKHLITGAAGFVGSFVAKRILETGQAVVGVDSLNDYYDVQLKLARLEELKSYPNFSFLHHDLAAPTTVSLLSELDADIIINLAAQAGVRYSMDNPQAYLDSNLQGFLNVLEVARRTKPKHLLYASSSSVYGSNSRVPFQEDEIADKPDSFYAATKRANELMAYTYSHLYGVPATALRFFTVYGPWGRPDMAVYKFALAMKLGKPIPVYGDGTMMRDFTYVEDTAQAVTTLINMPPEGINPHRIINIGNRKPESILGLVTLLEEKLGISAVKEFLPIPPGDVPITYSNTERLQALTGFVPNTSLDTGVSNFCDWFKSYHR